MEGHHENYRFKVHKIPSFFLVLGAGFVYFFYYQWYETESAQTQLVSKQQNTKSNKQDQPAQSEKQIAVEYFDANKWDNNTDLKKGI